MLVLAGQLHRADYIYFYLRSAPSGTRPKTFYSLIISKLLRVSGTGKVGARAGEGGGSQEGGRVKRVAEAFGR